MSDGLTVRRRALGRALAGASRAGRAAVLLGVLASLSVRPAWPEEARPFGQVTDWLRLSGDLRGRLEVNNFFQPEPALNNNNDYVFGGLRARLGVGVTTRWIDGLVQAEYTGLYGLPDDAVAVPGGALGTGALYFAEHPETEQHDLHLHQLFVTLKPELLHVPGLALTGGRFDVFDGLEYRTGDPKFDLLKTIRISQRLLGPFDFAQAARAFDGVRVTFDRPTFNVFAIGTHPTQGGFNIRAGNTITDIDVVYAALTAKRGSLLPGTEARLFYLYYGDRRDVQVVDNRPVRLRPFLDDERLAIHNLGAHALAVHPLGPGAVDLLVWGDVQLGRWTDLDHRAWALAAEAGYQLTGLPLTPWVRAGYFRGSGDGDPADGAHGTFFNVLPTARIYANFPFYNLMNIEDRFVQLILSPLRTVRVTVDYRALALAESSDLFYSGSGAQDRSRIFGYAGRPSNGARSLANVVQGSVSHTLNKYVSWSVFYAHAFGGAVIERFFRGQADADYGFVEVTARF
jgi:hypothetical protein